MKWAAVLSLIAMLPSALQAAAPATGRVLTVSLCTGDGKTRRVNLPIDPAQPSPRRSDACCMIACHAGGSRKRLFVSE